MKQPQGFTKDLSPEAQSRRAKLNPVRFDSAKQRALSLKSSWRNGPTVKSRNAHDAFNKCVAGNIHGFRTNGKGD